MSAASQLYNMNIAVYYTVCSLLLKMGVCLEVHRYDPGPRCADYRREMGGEGWTWLSQPLAGLVRGCVLILKGSVLFLGWNYVALLLFSIDRSKSGRYWKLLHQNSWFCISEKWGQTFASVKVLLNRSAFQGNKKIWPNIEHSFQTEILVLSFSSGL